MSDKKKETKRKPCVYKNGVPIADIIKRGYNA